MIRIALAIFSTALLVMPSHADTPSTNAQAAVDAEAAHAHALATDGCTVEKFMVHSPKMGRDIQALVVLPPEYKDHPEKKYPILYTLHGGDGPYETYSQFVPLRHELKDKPMIVVCFDGDNESNYIDAPRPILWSRDPKDTSKKKSLFTTFFFNELIPYIDKHYRVNPRQRMLTGLSMGSYGSYHYMLTKPDMFVSVSVMSGWFPVLTPPHKEELQWWEPVLGPYDQNENYYKAADIYLKLKTQFAKGVKLPVLMMRVGTEDPWVKDNRTMRAVLAAHGVTCDYGESPGGHNWSFWINHSAAIIDFHWRSLQQK